ncbi:Protein phosphatase 2C (PP2C)-like domain containing protein [Elaphomyces granulatus]
MAFLVFASRNGSSLLTSAAARAWCPAIGRLSHHDRQAPLNSHKGSGLLYQRRHFSSKPQITYRISVSCSAKGRPFNPEKTCYNFDSVQHSALADIPNSKYKRQNRLGCGEDAFFVGRVGNDLAAVAFGVADGVGGWAEFGIDPADFSHGLCSYMAKSALHWEHPVERLRPKNLIQMGYNMLLEDGSISAGGSTASVGVAQKDGRLELANLGDSGSVLLRLAAVHHYSVPQTHDFNTPYQLSMIPPQRRAQGVTFGGSYIEDLPRDAVVTNVGMQHGDVLILATDGVFDNLNNQDILKIITTRMISAGAWEGSAAEGIGISERLNELTKPGGVDIEFLSPQTSFKSAEQPSESVLSNGAYGHTLQALLAASIVGEAKLASIDSRRDGPFAKEAQRYFPWEVYHGGKVDDICALVVVAVEAAP